MAETEVAKHLIGRVGDGASGVDVAFFESGWSVKLAGIGTGIVDAFGNVTGLNRGSVFSHMLSFLVVFNVVEIRLVSHQKHLLASHVLPLISVSLVEGRVGCLRSTLLFTRFKGFLVHGAGVLMALPIHVRLPLDFLLNRRPGDY